MRKIVGVAITICLLLICSCATQSAQQVQKDYHCPNCNNISVSRFCETCGFDRVFGTTISAEDAKQLRQTADPVLIANTIKTVGDARIYVKANKINAKTPVPGGYTPKYGHWIFARTGYEELITNSTCCCGGYANLVSYLLAGDYPEVGQIRWLGCGNHTINYVVVDDKCYPFDINAPDIIFTYFDDGLKNIKQFGTSEVRLKYLQKYFSFTNHQNRNLNDVFLVFSHKTTEKAPYGVPWRGQKGGIILDRSYLSSVKVLYAAPDASISYDFVDSSIPGYNTALPKVIKEMPGENGKP